MKYTEKNKESLKAYDFFNFYLAAHWKDSLTHEEPHSKVVSQSLVQNLGESLEDACNFVKKEIPAQMFFYELCKVIKDNFFT